MPLRTAHSQPEWCNDLKAIVFKMQNDGSPVTVVVTALAVDCFAGADLIDAYERLERFPAYRTRAEEIANKKFEAGAIEDDGSVWIRQSDA